MRRNEARLLKNHVRGAPRQDPYTNLLVVGTFNDHIDSAAMREITGPGQKHLIDPRPADEAGHIWTWFDVAVYHLKVFGC